MKHVQIFLPVMLALSSVALGQQAGQAPAAGKPAVDDKQAAAELEVMRKYEAELRAIAEARKRADPQKLVDEFGQAIRQQWSYYRANGVDFDAELAALKKRVAAEKLSLVATEYELERILMLGIDGHSRVGLEVPPGRLQLDFGPVGKRIAAVRRDYGALLDADHPYVESIDGKPIAEWMQLAGKYVVKGSPQLVFSREARMVARKFRFLQEVGKYPARDTVDVVLASEDGKRRKTVQVEVDTKESEKSRIAQSLGPSRWLEGGQVGYLRIASMNLDAVKEIETWMPTFRNAKALIVDVRNNGGGSRDALLRLYSYLAAPTDPSRVINAAVYRLSDQFPEDHLSKRYMYRENDPHWNPAERAAIAQFKQTFKPQWTPPAGEFSDWHYLALSREDAPGVYHFDKPVVVLSNERIFSAADIFMAGMDSLPNVTIMGVPSGGGSARVASTSLQDGATELKIGSMISYQVDGRLFDGVGVPVDIRVDPVPAFYLEYGKARDNQLEAAETFLQKKVANP